jgi:4-amino-4-deoxy-L-arabinose transferase-like glycosyltransferase
VNFRAAAARPAAPWILAALHCALAAVLYLRGMNFCTVPDYCGWDWMWQPIPTVDLQLHPWSSFWYLHGQPPGFSLWGLAWLCAVGPEHFSAAMQIGYVLLGGLTVALTWRLAEALDGPGRLAAVAGVAMAVNPALLLYEAYTLYEMLVIAMVVGSAVCLWRALRAAALDRGRVGCWLAAYAGVLNLLVLTRSLYHWIFLWSALAFAWPAWRRLRLPWRIVWLAVALAPPGLWYAKNRAQYGFFGASSWFGVGFYKCVSDGFTYEELVDLRDRGVIPEFVEQRSSYQHPPSQYREYGFDRDSDVPLLSRDDFHNINMPQIARGYEQSAYTLIRAYPGHYLRSLFLSYGFFSAPPSRFAHLAHNRANFLGMWEPFVADVLYGAAVTDEYEILHHVNFGSLFFVGFPLLLVGAALWTRRRWHAPPTEPLQRARALLMAYLLFVCVYVAVIGCMFESGENMRFRFAIEPFNIIMLLIVLRAAWRRTPPRIRNWLRPELRRK